MPSLDAPQHSPVFYMLTLINGTDLSAVDKQKTIPDILQSCCGANSYTLSAIGQTYVAVFATDAPRSTLRQMTAALRSSLGNPTLILLAQISNTPSAFASKAALDWLSNRRLLD